jgi:hypothetical protein
MLRCGIIIVDDKAGELQDLSEDLGRKFFCF